MEDILLQVTAVFAEELREQAPVVADALIRSERSPSADERRVLMDEVYRYAHSMKGNAGTLGIMDLVELAHALETALVPFRDGARRISPDIAALLLRALDVAQLKVREVVGGNEAPLPAVAALVLELTEAKPSDRAEDPPPAPTSPAEVHEGNDRRSREETIRVSIDRLAAIDRQLDELREVRATLEHRVVQARALFVMIESGLAGSLAGLDRELSKDAREKALALFRGMSGDVTELTAQLGALDEELRQARMMPVKTLLAPLSRAVWEHAQSVEKRARLEISGAHVALDRKLLQELKDPLVHLVRNAVDHGVERPEARTAAGKSPEGVVAISVEQRGGTAVQIVVGDDGAGVDVERVKAKAIERGLTTEAAARTLTEAQVMDFLFAPGFSTAATLSRTSGRGVGLDVVKENVQKLGGSVTVSTQPGFGTRFTLSLPLTVATEQALLVEVSGHTLALPLGAVLAAQHVTVSSHERGESRVEYAGQPLEVQSLAALAGLPARVERRRSFPVVVLRAGERLLAVRVDKLLGERDVVLRALPPELGRLRHLTGAASLGDGRVGFVLSPRALAEGAREGRGVARGEAAARVRILVADDSITTRSLHRQVLEAAGFEVETASDGSEALRALQQRGADLVVSDVRMPQMDGLALTRYIRTESSLSQVPVILISSMDSDEDRHRADEAGASAYVSKASYERGELLRMVRSLLPS